MPWYDKHRRCQDGMLHEGKLELITWNGKDDHGTELGFGAVFLSEADELRHKFETKYKGDESKFFEYWPSGFRWTCCGLTADCDHSCDHHGSGKQPCTCDFCLMGKPVADSIFMANQQATRGLNLRKGPDPRSFHPVKAMTTQMGRALFGLDSGDGPAPSPFAGTLEKVRDITSLFTSSPTAAAAFAEAQQRVAAQDRAKGASSSSSSARGNGSNAAEAIARGVSGSSRGGAAASSKPAVPAGTGSSNSKPAETSSSSSSSASISRSKPDKGLKVWTCTQCGVQKPVSQMKVCSGCKAQKKVPYCSKECQDAHWPDHKKACKKARKAAKAAQAAVC